MLNFNLEKQYAVCATQFNKTIISELEKQGIKLKIFPSVEIVKNDLDEESKRYLSDLVSFDWLIFTDIFAVDFFVEIVEEQNIDLFDLDLTRVCALGEAVADRLRFSQIHADLIPSKIDADTVIKTFEDYIAEDFGELNFLIVQKSEVSKELEMRGARINRFEVYQTGMPNSSDTAMLKALLNGGAIDVFLFSRVEEIVNLKLLYPDVCLSDLLIETEIIALEAATYQHLREHGLSPKFAKI